MQFATLPAGANLKKRKRGRPTKPTPQTANSPPLLRLESPVAARTRSKDQVYTPSQVANVSDTTVTNTSVQFSVIKQADTAITRHLRTSVACCKSVCADVMPHFRIIGRARNEMHLKTLEAVYISQLKPELCAQKDFVKSLCLVSG